MPTARQIIESIQEESCRRAGLDPNDIQSVALAYVADVMAKRKAEGDEASLDAYYSRLQHIAARGELTRYQDPLSVDELITCWQLIQEGNPVETLEVQDNDLSLSDILIATAPTGDLNACAIQGDDGSHGILFETDLQAWAAVVGRLVEALLVTDGGDRIEIRHPNDSECWIGKDAVLSQLADVFVTTAVGGTTSMAAGAVMPTSDEEKKLIQLVLRGFMTFVTAHEFAHVIRGHHNMDERKRYWMPRGAADTWAKYETEYEPVYPALTLQMAATKLMEQGVELEADYYGYRYALNTLHHHPVMEALIQNDDGIEAAPPRFNILFVQLGMHLFWWSFEYLERTVRTLQSGHDGTCQKMFSQDFDVQDIVVRNTHPCPMSRMRFLNAAFPAGAAVDDLLQSVFARVWDVAYPKIQRLHRAGVRAHQKWVASDSDLSRQISLL